MSRRRGVRDGEPVEVAVPGFRGAVHARCDGPAGAPALLLVHGFSGSMRWWDRVVPLLADRFRIVRVDLLGHGATGGAAADGPVQAAAVSAVLDALDLHDVTAVGHSFGADVAALLAVTSARVSRLVIVTQAPDYSDAHLPRGKVLMTLPVLAPAIHRSALGLGRALDAAMSLRRPDTPARLLAHQALADFGALNTRMFHVVLIERRDRMARRPLDALVREAALPTLVVLGGKDHFYGDRSAGRYRAAGARVEVLPESSHSSPLIDEPDVLAALLSGFVAGTG